MDSLKQTNLRAMLSSDIEAGLRLCRAAHWNQLRRDWELFLKLSPRGCRVAISNDQIVGTVTTLSYQQRFAWIGMVLVDPQERRRGIGTRLLHEAMTLLKDETALRLDATPAGRPIYRQLGFADEYELSRMETVITTAPEYAGINKARPLTQADLVAVAELDAQVFGADRGALLQWLWAGAPEYAWLVTRGNELKGYMFGRHGYNFEHAGPIVAKDDETARQLISACLRSQVGRSFIVDVPRQHDEWQGWLQAIGFREQRPFLRMCYGRNNHPGLPQMQLAITGPEFG